MKSSLVSVLLSCGALSAISLNGFAQVVQLNATINAAQETPATTSTATGTATMLYNAATNTFDLTITLNNFAATLTASHFHEAAAGVAGAVVTSLGAEAVYTRSGNTLTGTFRGMTYTGTPLTLLKNGAYVNFHTAAFPGGEIRGQMIAQPKRLYAVINSAQEVPTNSSTAYGAALISYDAGANQVSLRVNLFNFTNSLSASHFHEGAPGVSGPVVTNLGGPTSYTHVGNAWSAVFNVPYTGDPIKLLTGGAYVNFHSNLFGGGEIRGQVQTSGETPSSRLLSLSARGTAGPGDQALISGLAVNGPEPLLVLIDARGPSLATFGVSNALSDPLLTLFDSSGRVLLANDDFLPAGVGASIVLFGPPFTAKESGMLLVLPPGIYTAVAQPATGGSGTALVEALQYPFP